MLRLYSFNGNHFQSQRQLKMVRLRLKRIVLLAWVGIILFFMTQVEVFQSVSLVWETTTIPDVQDIVKKPAKVLLGAFQTSMEAPPQALVTPTKCDIPDSPLFPLCSRRVKELNETWNENCHGDKYKVDLTKNCSVIQYLSEVETWCPMLPWRQRYNRFNSTEERPRAKVQKDVTNLLDMLEGERNTWLRNRIKGTWAHWLDAVDKLQTKLDLQNQCRKKVLIYMASLGEHKFFLDSALMGGPLGELTQWCDLISALYILGHELTISFSKEDLPSSLITPAEDGCARQSLNDGLDLIFTDIMGLMILAVHSGPDYSRLRCKMRVLDSFGTDAEFNYKYYKEEIPGGRSIWGDLNILLPQFMTMYPHSPDNTFLGFAVPQRSHVNRRRRMRNAALVYGKDPHFWKGRGDYFNTVNKYFDEVHATLGGNNEMHREFGIPEYVINHGIVNITTLIGLLESSKVFIGLGQPFEGPAALEALANGCFFLNPKFIPPLDRTNAEFFSNKPMMRKVTSQNPYAEVFVGKPFVQTVDIKNLQEVEQALQEIINSQEEPHLPLEFTHFGMLERVNTFVEKQDFCRQINWPPLRELQVIQGKESESCVDACHRKNLVCEPTFFTTINTRETLKRSKLECQDTVTCESILAPSINITSKTCLLQSQSLLFSCRAARPGVVRVCPCRSFQREQVALCQSC